VCVLFEKLSFLKKMSRSSLCRIEAIPHGQKKQTKKTKKEPEDALIMMCWFI